MSEVPFHDDSLWVDPEIENLIDIRPLIPQKPEIAKGDVGDWIWPSDNDYSIPLLLKDVQPRGLELPTNLWGAKARKNRVDGCTYHFYSDDYRFKTLWDDPTPIVNSGCNAVAETNFSTNDEMPFAVFLWHQYRKRWLSRYWQSYGIEIWADIAVAERFHEYSMLGLPKGWNAYASYAFGDYHTIDMVRKEVELAKKHAGKDPLVWVVCGTEKDLKICADEGWIGTLAHQQAFFKNVEPKKATFREVKIEPKKKQKSLLEVLSTANYK